MIRRRNVQRIARNRSTSRSTSSSTARSLEKYGWITAGVGAAALATGIVLLVINDDPNRYEPTPESDVFGRLWLLPSVAPDGHGAALLMGGALP